MVDTVQGSLITPNTQVQFSNLTLSGGMVTSNVSLTTGTIGAGFQAGIFSPSTNVLGLVSNNTQQITVDGTGVMASLANIQTTTSLVAASMVSNGTITGTSLTATAVTANGNLVSKGSIAYQVGVGTVSVRSLGFYWGQIF